jgi:hypothetical protein
MILLNEQGRYVEGEVRRSRDDRFIEPDGCGTNSAQTLACLLFVVFSMWIPRPSLADPQTSNSEIQGKTLGEPTGFARTDKAGRFEVRQLKQGEKYLVLAIDWDKDDSDEIFYYRSQLTGPLENGVTRLTVFMGPGEEKDCKTNKS